jgi:hypothetical protein
MSFESRDLVIDVLPLAQPGLQMCGQATAGGLDEDDEEEDDLECGQATAGGGPTSVTEDGLTLLRQQLRQTLTAEARV